MQIETFTCGAESVKVITNLAGDVVTVHKI